MSIPATLSSLETLNGLVEHEPAWWPDVCARIAGGTGYWEIAKERCIKPALFRGWIGGDAKREADYQTALSHRAEYRREVAAANVMKIASVEHEFVKPSDTLRAAELVLGSGSSSGISVGIGSGPGRVKIEVEFVGASGG